MEAIYQECLAREMNLRKIPFIAQLELEVLYKGEKLDLTYRPDFICFSSIILELKSCKGLIDEHRAQLFNYSKLAKLRLGLLVNFGHVPRVEFERIIF